MLSESERHMILQQRQQKLQRNRVADASQVSVAARQRKSVLLGLGAGYLGWKNVAMELEADSATTGNVGRHLGVQGFTAQDPIELQ
jgi:hypothetical protein